MAEHLMEVKEIVVEAVVLVAEVAVLHFLVLAQVAEVAEELQVKETPVVQVFVVTQQEQVAAAVVLELQVKVHFHLLQEYELETVVVVHKQVFKVLTSLEVVEEGVELTQEATHLITTVEVDLVEAETVLLHQSVVEQMLKTVQEIKVAVAVARTLIRTVEAETEGLVL